MKIVIAVVVTALVVAFVTAKIAISYHTKLVEAKIGNADEKAREIIDEALKTAEAKKKEALLEQIFPFRQSAFLRARLIRLQLAQVIKPSAFGKLYLNIAARTILR